MTDSTDEEAFAAEVEAIGSVLSSLKGLSGPARERVIEYVMRALSIRIEPRGVAPAPPAVLQRELPDLERPPTVGAVNDIRSLKDSKQPNSANQMAAVAAYYLSELAPEAERSDVIDAAQLDRLFRQAGFPLPQRIGMTLPNATQAGYFDSTGEPGKYKLNPVGYNLVAHGLPSGADGGVRRRSTKKAAPKKAAAKKAGATKAAAKSAGAKKTAAQSSSSKKAAAAKKA